MKSILSEFAKFLKRTDKDLKRTLQTFGKDVTGQTVASITGNALVDLNAGTVEYEVQGSKVVDYINDGRPPGTKMPPPGSLDDWLAKLSIPKAADYPIRRDIAVNGIKPTPVYKTSLDSTLNAFDNEMPGKITLLVSKQLTQSIKKALAKQ